MPPQALQAFCEMYLQAESQGRWPSQLVNGKVVSLAKVPTPGSPSDFRPITIFSLLYRCWSSFHARKALMMLEPHLPDTLYGSRQGRQASQVWSKLLWTIERSYQHDVALAGYVLDLQKAFNLLPRLAVFEIAAHLGLPGFVLVGWAGALSQMQRHFVIRQSLSEGVPSVTGFPEGCGLSCVAMVIVDAAFHSWQSVFFPLCTVLTYVDDWQILCNHHDLLHGAKLALERFVAAMDLLVDSKKSYAWSLSSQGRFALRSQGVRVVLAEKNLGAHVQLSRKHTNASLMDRIHAFQPIWTKLRVSACAYGTKVRALKAAAWPKALHAVASTSLSESTFHKLRAGAMRGLDAEGAGANAWIHLGMIEHPSADPQFSATIQSIRSVRECGDQAQLLPRLAEAVSGDSSLPENSITNTLVNRLQTLGWHVTSTGWMVDLFGTFSIFDVSLAEVVFRAQWAWQQVIASKVSHRPGFCDLHQADPSATRQWLQSLPCDDQALFRKCLNGSHFTQDGKSHCQETGTDQCPYCACSDSRFHRFWECERFETHRAAIAPSLRNLMPTLPEFLTSYGWNIRAHTQREWLSMLADIPSPAEVVLEPLAHDLHLFTDGSCMNQSFPQCRVASWAVVTAHNDRASCQVVASGPLPGLFQSSYRAEIFAILRALSAAQCQRNRVHLWSDCNAVVVRLRKVLRGCPLRVNSAHFDLWSRISDVLLHFEPGQVIITKVRAHQLIAEAESPLEEWCFWHNCMADKAASLAQQCRPQGFWEFYSSHVSAVQTCESISRQVQKVQLAISQEVVRETSGHVGEFREELCETPDVPGDAWHSLPLLSIPRQAVRWYGDKMVRTILSWFWFAVSTSAHPVCWVSQYQLYLDFTMCGECGPLHLQGWSDGANTPEVELLSISFHVRVRWFAKVLKECLRHLGAPCTYRYCRPFSNALMLHTGCLALPWDPARLGWIDSWLQTHCLGGVRRSSTALRGVPLALKDGRFPSVVISSV